MKYPTARKLPSGSWYCRVRVHGKDISITRPTKKEAIAEAMAIKAGIKKDDKLAPTRLRAKTVSQAIDDYIAARENVLSPSTIRGYRIIHHHRFQNIQQQRIFDITEAKWQRIVNDEAKRCAGKTLKNAWGLLSAVIKETTRQQIFVRLPQVIFADGSFLTPEQILVFVEAIKGNKYEIPMLLALHSLRRSEILAFRWENIDMESGWISVNGAAVQDKNNRLVQKKETKNSTSRRKVPILPPLAEAMKSVPRQTGLVYQASPNTLRLRINSVCRQVGLPEVSVHGLRRSFASLAYHQGLSEEMTMRFGGWSNIYTMRKIYTKLSACNIKAQSAALRDFFQPLSFQNGNENGDEGNRNVGK